MDDDTGYLVNGEFSTEFSSDALGEFEITATVDNQEVKLTETVAATVWYVNATADPGEDGKTNETAFQKLKDALTEAENGDIIMIASGTYTVTAEYKGLKVTNKVTIKNIINAKNKKVKKSKKVTKIKISLKKVNGKTYTGKTNSLGKVTFKITNLSKKASYKAKISYAGDKTYQSASKTVTLKVK